MTFSTCTINPGENERMVKWALDEFAGALILVDVGVAAGKAGLSGCGLTDDERKAVRRWDYLEDEEEENPSSLDSSGFFVAKFVKTKRTWFAEMV